jgi:hypothetical protein
MNIEEARAQMAQRRVGAFPDAVSPVTPTTAVAGSHAFPGPGYPGSPQPVTGYPGSPQPVTGYPGSPVPMTQANPMALPSMAPAEQPFPKTEALPGNPQPITGVAPLATVFGVDQNGRSLAFPDAGPDASGVTREFEPKGVIASSTPGNTTIEQARATARAKSVKG